MSRALVKWQGGKLAGPSPVGDSRDAMGEALALLGTVLAPRRISSRAGYDGEIADVPRICSVHKKPYAARYIRGSDGRFRHAQTIRVTEALYLGQYADNAHRAVVTGEDIADETCPWCGASGFGSVRCGECDTEVCYGRTTGRLFRCCCGHQGSMVSSSRAHEGVSPRDTRGGYAAGGNGR